jgi:hypothetical protein
MRRWEEEQIRLDRRAALAPWALYNVNRDAKKKRKPFDLDDFVINAWPSLKRAKDTKAMQSPEEQLAAMQAFAAQVNARQGPIRRRKDA